MKKAEAIAIRIGDEEIEELKQGKPLALTRMATPELGAGRLNGVFVFYTVGPLENIPAEVQKVIETTPLSKVLEVVGFDFEPYCAYEAQMANVLIKDFATVLQECEAERVAIGKQVHEKINKGDKEGADELATSALRISFLSSLAAYVEDTNQTENFLAHVLLQALASHRALHQGKKR